VSTTLLLERESHQGDAQADVVTSTILSLIQPAKMMSVPFLRVTLSQDSSTIALHRDSLHCSSHLSRYISHTNLHRTSCLIATSVCHPTKSHETQTTTSSSPPTYSVTKSRRHRTSTLRLFEIRSLGLAPLDRLILADLCLIRFFCVHLSVQRPMCLSLLPGLAN
jgi:hypothetical protein